MKILDRYIIRQFLINFVILCAVLMLLFVLVDLIVDLDEFLEAGERWADDYGGTIPATLVAVVDYYGPMLVLIYVFFSGLLVAGAAGFALSGFHRSRELVAIVASGVSLYRIAAPIIVVGILLSAAALPLQEFVVPPLAPKLARSKSDVKYRAIESFPVRLASDGQGNLFDAARFDAEAQMLYGVTILELDERGLTRRHITADQAIWVDEPQGWELRNGFAVRPMAMLDPLAAVGPPEPEEVRFIPSDLAPTVLMARQASIVPRLLSLAELQAMHDNPAVTPQDRLQIARIIWSRFSTLVVNALVLVMGMVFFLQLGQPNLLRQAIKAATIALGAWCGGLVMLQMSEGILNPVAAAWLPVALYLPIAAILLQWART